MGTVLLVVLAAGAGGEAGDCTVQGCSCDGAAVEA